MEGDKALVFCCQGNGERGRRVQGEGVVVLCLPAGSFNTSASTGKSVIDSTLLS